MRYRELIPLLLRGALGLVIGAAAGVEFLGPLAARAAATAWAGRLVRLLPLGLAALIVATVFLRGPSGAFIYFQF